MSTEQKIMTAEGSYAVLDRFFSEIAAKNILLVCGSSFSGLKICGYFDTLKKRTGIGVTKFSDFRPNPRYDSVANGVKVFNEKGCDSIVAVGGGSAMDVAKCIRLYSNMDPEKNFLTQQVTAQDIPLLAVPTTAGSGSEATRYAVIYYKGEKQSITHEGCIPSAVLLDASVLDSLPDYHKKSAMLDALCHAIESFWSVNSTDESMRLSKAAIRQILASKDRYLAGDAAGNMDMLTAANTAGRAINITQTTAGHAMCYRLTGLYGIAHGHAAALCISALFGYMIQNIDKCIDPRGKAHLAHVFSEVAEAMGCQNAEEAADKFGLFLNDLGLGVPTPEENDWEILKNSVNPVRLRNNPIRLDTDVIDMLYHQMLKP